MAVGVALLRMIPCNSLAVVRERGRISLAMTAVRVSGSTSECVCVGGEGGGEWEGQVMVFQSDLC